MNKRLMNNHLMNRQAENSFNNTKSRADILGKVSTNLNQQAIALAYETGDYAPKVLAKGRGVIAERIIATAKEHNLFVHESKDLVALLMQVDLDDHIPAALYQAIAEILAWLYRLENGAEAPENAPRL